MGALFDRKVPFEWYENYNGFVSSIDLSHSYMTPAVDRDLNSVKQTENTISFGHAP